MQELNIQNLILSGVHFGHELKKWNPKMKRFVYKEQDGIHIINLKKTLVCAKKAMAFLEETCKNGGEVIFVGTKSQAIHSVQKAAEDCHQFYVTKRWLGGTLTNFETLKVSIDRMKKIQKIKERFELDHYSKKEKSRIEKEYKKMEESLRGIKDMKDVPSVLFIVDIQKEKIALKEAKKLGIPVVALADTNCDPYLLDYPIPANDDSFRSIEFFTKLAAKACLKGWEVWQKNRDKTQALQEKKKGIPSQEGPQVLNVNKTRRLVAAGTAEDVEIELELKKEDNPSKQQESPKQEQ